MSDLIYNLQAPGVGTNTGGTWIGNISNSGQNGYLPDLQYINGAMPYVPRNVIAVVLSAPGLFNRLPNTDSWISSLNALFGRHARKIDGLNKKLSVDVQEAQIGGGSDVIHAPGRVTQATTDVTISGHEIYNKSITRYVDEWIRLLIADPRTTYPAIMTLLEGSVAVEFVPSEIGASVLFIEPAYNGRDVLEAYLGVNMWPKEGLDNSSRKDLGSGGSILEWTLPFTGTFIRNEATRRFAHEIMSTIHYLGANPDMQPVPIDAISEDVKAAGGSYIDQVNRSKWAYNIEGGDATDNVGGA